ncbi:MAG TPA: hypothetical protein PLH96_01475, partial [Candidatus Paceibacterota bacterium]|nr:hypothetical protein [Candidatus Paceibacterota bacterium]
ILALTYAKNNLYSISSDPQIIARREDKKFGKTTKVGDMLRRKTKLNLTVFLVEENKIFLF